MSDTRADLRFLASALALALGVACDGPAASPDAGPGDLEDAAAPDDAATMNDAGVDGGSGPAACAPASLDVGSGDWDARFTIPGFLGADGYTPGVHAFAHDPDGHLLATGYFKWAGTEEIGALARLRDGAWEPVRTDLPAESFSALAVHPSGHLALSTFAPLTPSFPPVPQAGELLVDTGSGLESVGSFTGVVRALAWVGDALWVAGRFDLEGGPSDLAVWTEGAWSPPPGGAVDGPVYTLLVEADAVLIGGSFTQVGGVSAVSVAEWSETGWRALDMAGFGPTPYGAFRGPIVYGLARDEGGQLFAGGSFHEGTDPVGGAVARWTGSEWEVLGSGFARDGGLSGDQPAVVSDVAVFDGQLYATGCLTKSADGAVDGLPGVARWNGAGWEAPPGSTDAYIADAWYPGFDVCGGEPSGTAILEARLQQLHTDGAQLFVGGLFGGIGGVPSKAIIAYDGEHWIPQGDTSGIGLSGAAMDLAVGGADCSLYAIGQISHAGGVTSESGVYRFDGDAWSAVGGPRPEGVTCDQLAVSPSGDVYLGCKPPFTGDGPPAPRVYRRDGDAWVQLGEIPEAQDALFEMRFDPEGSLWVLGGAGYLARWDGDAFTTIESGFDGPVMSIAFDPEGSGELVIGGGFTHIGDSAFARVARWDGEGWQPLGDGFTTPVTALAWDEAGIYASTSSAGDPSVPHVVLGFWDGAAWEELATPERGLPAPMGDSVHQLRALLPVGGQLIAAGGVWPETGGRNAFIYDGERFHVIGGGVGAIAIDTVAANAGGLWFGGFLATTGAGAELAPSVGIAHFDLTP